MVYSSDTFGSVACIMGCEATSWRIFMERTGINQLWPKDVVWVTQSELGVVFRISCFSLATESFASGALTFWRFQRIFLPLFQSQRRGEKRGLQPKCCQFLVLEFVCLLWSYAICWGFNQFLYKWIALHSVKFGERHCTTGGLFYE